jgi:hypothetical protein
MKIPYFNTWNIAAPKTQQHSQVFKVGSPIRRSMDQSLFAAPHGLSQRITSFIACACQGIHQMPLRHLIVLIANDHLCFGGFGIPNLLACARRGSKPRLRIPFTSVIIIDAIKNTKQRHRFVPYNLDQLLEIMSGDARSGNANKISKGLEFPALSRYRSKGFQTVIR